MRHQTSKKGLEVHRRTISWRRSPTTGLTVYGYGVRFFVDRGRLVIEDGFANEAPHRRTILSRGSCTLQRIAVVGRTGMITLDALHWLSNLGVALLFVDQGGTLNSVFTPGGLEGSKVRIHRFQANAKESDVGVRIARLLIEKKLRGQNEVLAWLADPGRQVPLSARSRYHSVRTAALALHSLAMRVAMMQSLEEIVEAERTGAAFYWSALQGIPLRWQPKAGTRAPHHWLTTQPRESFRTGNRNGATDPTNSILNYGYALLEAETRIACLNAGLHPGLGIFHADKDGRASFVYDLMEPARPVVDRLVLDFIGRHQFCEGDCYETREGFCRLDPKIAERLTRWMPSMRKVIVPTARSVVTELSLAARLPRFKAL